MNQFFPYAGSSSKYARMIAEMVRREGYETYAEPMVGSGAVFFQLAPGLSYIGDVEWLHANLYKCVKVYPQLVADTLPRTAPDKDWFLETQETITIEDSDYDIHTAGLWYTLLILCYNGVVKKKDGRPYLTWGDRYKTWEKRLPSYRQKIRVVSQMLKQTFIHHGDYQGMEQADVAFFDPPWIGSDEDYGVDFDHQRLADYLAGYEGKWILTINWCEEAAGIYVPVSEEQYWLEPHYSVAPTPGGRGKRVEMLLTNFKPKIYGG